ncbi:DUF1338 domain-containing protein [Pleionea litopenaei]|uniref:2-oxoadipate dioxygenase/decarboxylase n=1 Tax=Pleionea litopenaei TaxID=3070815 RepID=A0AA51X9D0_9GAMM|nr:DUF1338 domain-containing protein [Pleionea sp. HL-JVS1]WMS89050.1 DUF1338 domain-containing protein [Pleionea sp. HL-JVS1]
MHKLLQDLWDDYLTLTPDAKRIHDLFAKNGETIVNDHIALRTFNKGALSLEAIKDYLAQFNYEAVDEYHFEEKKLRAYHFEIKSDLDAPKIFVSELLLEQMPKEVIDICEDLIAEADKVIAKDGISLPMLPWRTISSNEYETLLKHSEYAAWLATFGLRANHFTVSVNHLTHLSTLEDVNQFVKSHDFSLNQSGGEVKGSEEVSLKQSSTMANFVNWKFSDQPLKIRSCFYEFAERFNIPGTNQQYRGFVAASADKIFESTNVAA